jgi:hypothetical protein
MFLDTALAILSHSDPSSHTSSPSEDVPLTLLITGGFFQELLSRSSTAIGFELMNQIHDDSSLDPASGKMTRKPLHDALESIGQISRKRLEIGSETNAKAYLFLCMVQAQASAMERGDDFRQAIAARAVQAAEEAYGLLRDLLASTPEESTPSVRGDGGSEMDSVVDWDLLVSCVWGG